ncbi:prepilin-type N-terminal cleavage/methylation domain-containing protein [Planctomycetota bacterium]|nr:prepilin-type N-terminal cleavage/methylation domain-containing protein [Planctomycetota bacterium]
MSHSSPHPVAMLHLQEPPLRRDRPSAGFALIEMVIAASILMIGALGFLQLFAAAADLNGANREGAVAREAAQRALTRLAAFEPRENVFALHNDDPTDDPAGQPLAGFLLSGFEVDGLSPRADDPDSRVGRVIFPIDPITGALHPEFMSSDFSVAPALIGAGVSEEVADAYGLLLPVVVRIEWQHKGRPIQHEIVTLISPR